jgi:hypothetical protein
MDDERLDFTALDPWQDAKRMQAVCEDIVEAHRSATARTPLYALLASLAPRAVLTAALATALIWVLPSRIAPPKPHTTAVTTAEIAHRMERGHMPNGLELLRLAEVSNVN